MNAATFVRELSSLRHDNVFNPYSMRCAVYDNNDAPQRRAETLLRIIEAAATVELDSVWIGRDLGYRGGRRSGLALTDDGHVAVHAGRWGVNAQRFTKGEMISERTAATIWGVLGAVERPIFLWNAFPLHPHQPKKPFSNRSHNRVEGGLGEAFLADLLALIRPRRLVTLGLDARETANRVFRGEVKTLRHPSYGGHAIFLRQVRELYALKPENKGQITISFGG